MGRTRSRSAFCFSISNQHSKIGNLHHSAFSLQQFSIFLYSSRMISGRRKQVIFFTVFGICLVAIAVTLNISWVVLKLNADF